MLYYIFLKNNTDWWYMIQLGIDNYGEHSAQIFTNKDDSILLVRSAFKAFEGEIPTSSYIRIGLNLSGGGLVKQWYNTNLIKSEWRRGSITVWSKEACYASCPCVDMLGLALNLDVLRKSGYITISNNDIRKKTLQTLNSEFLSAMLLGLWRSAQIYGVSTLFFQQGVQQVLEQLLNSPTQGSVATNRRPLTNRALTRVQTLIKTNLQSNINVARMAELLQMDETSFSKSFTRSTGMTPFAYITAQRMEQAQILLKLDYSVTDVAISVGYANPSKFSAAFRRYVGIKPSTWRRNNN